MVSPQYQPAAQETGQPCETCGAQSGTERGVLLVNKQGVDATFILNGIRTPLYLRRVLLCDSGGNSGC